MKIGIIGAGGIGQAFAGQVVKAGYEVIVSNSRGPESLAAVVSQLGPRARAGTRQEAAQADVVVLSVNLGTRARGALRFARMERSHPDRRNQSGRTARLSSRRAAWQYVE